MKYRNGFVTNSSSSSFICNICGREESGWDISVSECDMYECVNGHVFCRDEVYENKAELIHIIIEQGYNTEDFAIEELNGMNTDELIEMISDDGDNVPECVCPICSFSEYSSVDMRNYLLKEYKVPEEEVFAIVKKVNSRRKKLYDVEYITYVCHNKNLDPTSIVNEWKTCFKSYEDFKDYISQ